MKFAIFAPYGGSLGHLETDLELAQRHIAKGDVVHVILCRAELPTCDFNPNHHLQRCFECKAMASKSWSLLKIPRNQFHQLGFELPKLKIPNFKDQAELTAFTWNGKPVGEYILNNLITAEREPELVVTHYSHQIELRIRQYIGVSQAVSRILSKIQPDLFYLFNGRSGPLHAALETARDLGIRTLVGERDNYAKFILLENAHSVDLSYLKRDLQRAATIMATDPEAQQKAEAWFNEQRSGPKGTFFNFPQRFAKCHLPEKFNSQRRNIAVFLSSEDELSGLMGWKNPFFRNQIECIEFLLSKVEDPNIHFTLRAHPHLRGVDNSQTRALKRLVTKNVTVVLPDEKVDSYALLDASEKVISFGSTIGIEAVYWGKPSILIGPAVFEDLACVHQPESKEELLRMIEDPLPLPNRQDALGYSYWYTTRGEPFQFIRPYEPDKKPYAEFGGTRLQPSRMSSLILRLFSEYQTILRVLKRVS